MRLCVITNYTVLSTEHAPQLVHGRGCPSRKRHHPQTALPPPRQIAHPSRRAPPKSPQITSGPVRHHPAHQFRCNICHHTNDRYVSGVRFSHNYAKKIVWTRSCDRVSSRHSSARPTSNVGHSATPVHTRGVVHPRRSDRVSFRESLSVFFSSSVFDRFPTMIPFCRRWNLSAVGSDIARHKGH